MRRYLIIVFVVLLAGCKDSPYRVGVWAGPTGANVAKMAESEINFSGGANHRRLKAHLVSQGAVSQNLLTPELLEANLDTMVTDTNVIAVVTRVMDDITEAATQKFEAAGVPYLVLNPVDENYAATHPHAFLLAPSVQEQARFLVDRAASDKALDRVAIIHVKDNYGQSMAGALEQALRERGANIVHVGRYAQTADSATMLAHGLETASKKPTAVFWAGRSPSLLIGYGTMLNRAPGVRVYGTDLIESYHVYQWPRYYDGLRFPRLIDPLSSDSVVAGLRDRQVIWIGRNELTNEAVLTFDAMKLIDHALDQGATSRQALTEYLRKLGHGNAPFNGTIGTIAFDAQQRASLPLQLAVVTHSAVGTAFLDSTSVAVSRD